jgi:hypothetical protein
VDFGHVMASLEQSFALLSRLECTDEERNRLLKAIRDEATKDPESLIAFARRLDLTNMDEALTYSDFIEAVADGRQYGESLILEELKRILEWCDRVPSKSLLFVLGSFAFLEGCKSESLRRSLIQRYVTGLNSKHVPLRRTIIDLISGFQLADYPDSVPAVKQMLRDSDWKVRARAEELLRVENLLESGYQPSFIDRVMRRLFEWRI